MNGWNIFSYVPWLYEHIETSSYSPENYICLLGLLHSTEFKWSIDMDENRCIDGLELRKTYMEEDLIPSVFCEEGVPCSVLEMMVALALRTEKYIMGNGYLEGGSWFWRMCENLEIAEFTDDVWDDSVAERVNYILDRWLNREFQRNGVGSPFPLGNKRCYDQRKVEIWFQLCGYLSEQFV